MNTLATYLLLSKDITKWQKMTAAEPMVAAQTKYYQAHIGSVKTAKDFVNNYQLFSYALNAYGLGDQVYAKAMFQKVLEQGTSSSKSLAYTLHDPRILALAKTFNFATNGASTTQSTAVQSGVVNQYVEQTLETNEGQSEPGVELALYFQQHATSVSDVYGILADKKLLKVVQTALGISSLTSAEPIDTQAKLISSKLNVADFQDPKKLQSFIKRFAAMYDINNSSSASSGGAGFSASLISSWQGVKF